MVTPEQVNEAVESHLAGHKQMSIRHESGVVSWPVEHKRERGGWQVLVSHHVRRFGGPCLGTEMIAVGYVHEFLPSFAPLVEDSARHPLDDEGRPDFSSECVVEVTPETIGQALSLRRWERLDEADEFSPMRREGYGYRWRPLLATLGHQDISRSGSVHGWEWPSSHDCGERGCYGEDPRPRMRPPRQRASRPSAASGVSPLTGSHVGSEWKQTRDGRKLTAQFGEWRMLVDRATGDWNGFGKAGRPFSPRWLPGGKRAAERAAIERCLREASS